MIEPPVLVANRREMRCGMRAPSSCLVASDTLIEKLALSVFSTNTRAIAFYSRLGFVEEGRRVRHIKRGPGDYEDEVLMGRWL